MTDLTYVAIKASSRKGTLLTDQQLIDLTSARDLKDLLNRIKERYPKLSTTALTPNSMEEGLLSSHFIEIDEFQRVAPELSTIFKLLKREVEEEEAVNLLKEQLGIIPPSVQKRTREDLLAALKAMGFEMEVKSAALIYEKYKVPALIDSVFARQRILALAEAVRKFGGDTAEGLRDYLRYKIDVFNLDLLLRGIRNSIDRKALAELLIYQGGSVKMDTLKEAVSQPDLDKALSFIKAAGFSKVESARELERYYEQRVQMLMSRTYYNGYLGAGAILGYLELKLREIRNIIRIANSISREIEPKRIAQEFIF